MSRVLEYIPSEGICGWKGGQTDGSRRKQEAQNEEETSNGHIFRGEGRPQAEPMRLQ